VVVVGDRPEDEEACNGAGFEYHAAVSFFDVIAGEIRDAASDDDDLPF